MDDKKVYEELMEGITAVLEGEDNLVSVLSTLACMLKHGFDKNFWVGFYLEDENSGLLKVGPYQGTLGCLTIEPERGVCGRAYRTKESQVVDDVHSDQEHIACDAASLSEIVVPVFRKDGSVYGVLDVDSDRLAAYNGTDREFLESMVRRFVEPLV